MLFPGINRFDTEPPGEMLSVDVVDHMHDADSDPRNENNDEHWNEVDKGIDPVSVGESNVAVMETPLEENTACFNTGVGGALSSATITNFKLRPSPFT